ncbi:hypothetical protein C8R42DRAFT_711024 [Lentinula raphanica]|nr:hypothetical protein C8R42DRAFT_711024 [Lentinula raphanica]
MQCMFVVVCIVPLFYFNLFLLLNVLNPQFFNGVFDSYNLGYRREGGAGSFRTPETVQCGLVQRASFRAQRTTLYHQRKSPHPFLSNVRPIPHNLRESVGPKAATVNFERERHDLVTYSTASIVAMNVNEAELRGESQASVAATMRADYTPNHGPFFAVIGNLVLHHL